MTTVLRTCRGLFLCAMASGCGLIIETRDPDQGADGGTDGDVDPVCRVDPDCDDGLYCTGPERCDEGRCVRGDFDCPDDGHVCTVEACDEEQDQCKSEPDHRLCPAGQTCTDRGCMEEPCDDNSDCDDGLYCNGVEICGPSRLCVPGPTPGCGGCLVCSEAVGGCMPNNLGCEGSDGNLCNGEGICQLDGTCLPAAVVSCGLPFVRMCRACNPLTGFCDLRDPALCDDHAGCSSEYCGADDVCNYVYDPEACPDDGIACTVDTCEPADPAADPISGCLREEADRICGSTFASFECVSADCVPGSPAADALGCILSYRPEACPATRPFCEDTGTCSPRRCSMGCATDSCRGSYYCDMGTSLCRLRDDSGCEDLDGDACMLPYCDRSGGAGPMCGMWSPPGCP